MKKVYLETPEAVIKALKDGKEVFLEEGGAGKVKLIDGFCVKEWNDQFNINYTINLRDKPFVYEQEPLKIEVGKWYETRDHQKARCFRVTDRACNCSFTIDNGFVFCTYKDGKYGVEKECSLDIIGSWDE